MSDLVRPNGAGVMALQAADLLTDAGHEAVVLGGAIDADLARRLDEHHHGAAAFTNDERALDASVTEADHQSFLRAFGRWFDEQLDEHQPAVVYVHNCGRVISQGGLAELSRRIPVVHTLHDEWFFTDAHYRFRSALTGDTIRTFEPGHGESLLEHRYEHLFDVPLRAENLTLVGPSRWITQRAARVYPDLPVEHVPNPVDSELFTLQDRATSRRVLGLPAEQPIVLFVGSPTQERKGLAAFEAATRRVQTAAGAPVLRLVAGGSASVAVRGADDGLRAGPIRDLLDVPTHNPVGNLGIDGPGLVLSGIDRELMPHLYGAADVLVHPSRIDNLPTVPIEAGLCGTRCLASDVGGTAETIADPDDLFDVDIDAQSLGECIGAAIAASSSETVQQREARRATQVARFSVDVHREVMLPILARSAARGVTDG